jgi:hypothetical protein
MTDITSTPTTSGVSAADLPRSLSLRWGVPAVAVSAALSAISVYGDHTLTASQRVSQEHALPVIIAVAVVLGGLIFGLGVPRLLRSQRLPGWALAVGILGLAALAAYWSGLPVVFGAAALLLGTTGRRLAATQAKPAKLATAAAVIGALAVSIDVIATIVSTYH